METTHLLVRPAPRYEHGGQWFGSLPSDEPAVPSPSAPPVRAQPPARQTDEPLARAARTFVVGAMTQVLEVLDRRRGVGQLADLVVPHVIDQITALQRAPEMAAVSGGAAAPLPVAALRRVHIQMCGADEAEFFGNYLRGERVLAFAGRAELVPLRVRKEPGAEPYKRTTRTELRWRIRSIALG